MLYGQPEKHFVLPGYGAEAWDMASPPLVGTDKNVARFDMGADGKSGFVKVTRRFLLGGITKKGAVASMISKS